MTEIELPCPTCAGTGDSTCEDRHTGTNMDTCQTCGGRRTIPARPGESRETSWPYAVPGAQQAGPAIVRHRKTGGLYEVLFRGVTVETDRPLADYAEVIVCRRVSDGGIVVRPASLPIPTNRIALYGARVQAGTPLANGDEAAVYRGQDGDALVWVRPTAEMDDGRFEPAHPDTPTPSGDVPQPGSSVGGVEGLSRKATQGEWRWSPEFRHLVGWRDHMGTTIIRDASWHNGSSAEDGTFIVALVNAYRSGRLIEVPTPSGDLIQVAREAAAWAVEAEGGKWQAGRIREGALDSLTSVQAALRALRSTRQEEGRRAEVDSGEAAGRILGGQRNDPKAEPWPDEPWESLGYYRQHDVKRWYQNRDPQRRSIEGEPAERAARQKDRT